MSDFTKNKIVFAVTLLATLFTITPIISSVGSWGYQIYIFHLQISDLYYFLAVFLALSVYFYGIQFLTERQHRVAQMAQLIGDTCYSIAIVAPPVYVSMYILVLAVNLLVPILPETVLNLLRVVFVLFVMVGPSSVVRKIVASFGLKERTSQVENLQKQELANLNRARQVFNGGFYDLTILESYKVIDLTIRRALVSSGQIIDRDSSYSLVEKATKLKIISPDLVEKVDRIRKKRNEIAHNNLKVTKDEAEEALMLAARVLSAVEGWTSAPRTTPRGTALNGYTVDRDSQS